MSAEPTPGGTVCLVAIVKNESAVITRMLDSLWDLVDAWVIADTGSTDDTEAIIAKFVEDHPKPGVVLHHEWKGFGDSRTAALAAARARFPECEFQFMMDADDFYAGPRDAATGKLLRLPLAGIDASIQGVQLQLRLTPEFVYQRCCVFRASLPWKYVGVLHEYPMVDAPTQGTMAILPIEFHIQARAAGARSEDPDKYSKDALTLEAALLKEPTNMRYKFYCAQSWRDAGMPARAIPHYLDVAVCTNVWTEERYVSYRNLIRLESDLDKCVAYAWAAFPLNSARREVVLNVMNKARVGYAKPVWRHDLLAMGVLALRVGAPTPTQTWLFTEIGAYGWTLYDEVGLAAFYLQQPALALWAFQAGLALAPDANKPHLQANIDVTKKMFPTLV